ncbi:hypothetical protein [Streptomyces sp. KLOTTS4A1]
MSSKRCAAAQAEGGHRARKIDGCLPKIEELVVRSQAKVYSTT